MINRYITIIFRVLITANKQATEVGYPVTVLINENELALIQNVHWHYSVTV